MALLRRRIHSLSAPQKQGLLELCAKDPVNGISLASQLERWNRWGHGDVVVLGKPAAPTAGAWTTGSAILMGIAGVDGGEAASKSELRALAAHCGPRLTRNGSVMGPAADVEALWPELIAQGIRSRAERWNQPVLVAPDSVEKYLPQGEKAWWARELRAARPDETELVLPASVAMFHGELGYDPTNSGSSYARHVGQLASQGRTYVLFDDGAGGPALPGGPMSVAFKADVGALWGNVSQLTGVWTRPDLRGQGLGSAALAATVERVRAEHVGPAGVVSLYVNDFNTAARRLYETLGFTQTSTFATILL